MPHAPRTPTRLVTLLSLIVATASAPSCSCPPEAYPSADKYFDLYAPSSTVRRLFYAFETDQPRLADRCFLPNSSPEGTENPADRWRPVVKRTRPDLDILRTPTPIGEGRVRIELPRPSDPPVVFILEPTIYAYDEDAGEWKEIPRERARDYDPADMEVDWQIADQASWEATHSGSG